MKSIILIAGSRLLVALLTVFSIYMLLRGHNQPGGGFIGGLLAAVAFVIYAIAVGTKEAREILRYKPSDIAAVGLGMALFAGLMAAIFSDALFTGQWLFIGATPDDKGLPLSSVLIFDVGVFLVVLGSVLAIVFALEEEV
jgi:multicomponent Na+:H+ antiporter subunit B